MQCTVAARPASAVSTALVLGLGVALGGCTDVRLALEPDMQPAFSQAPVVITFDKQFDAVTSTETLLVWNGTVQADGMTGDLVSSINLLDAGTKQTGQVLHATVRWVATGDVEFEIMTSGIVNFANGAVRTNGHGLSGLGAGAVVHQEGQLTGLDAVGLLRFNPATAR
ncbi:hypothetical protein BH23GEM9_BH23GEM9_14360 [soil metagenome]